MPVGGHINSTETQPGEESKLRENDSAYGDHEEDVNGESCIVLGLFITHDGHSGLFIHGRRDTPGK
jgi:hypothetical protein